MSRSALTWRARGRAALYGSVMVGWLAACDDRARPTHGAAPPPPGVDSALLTSALVAGTPDLPAAAQNPYLENAHVVAEGKRLFQWFNCAGCHGLLGGGGIGPPFADGKWIHGGAPANLYQSIVQGRPEGMPAFRSLSSDQVWKLVAYVRSLAPDAGGDAIEASARGTAPPGGATGARDK